MAKTALLFPGQGSQYIGMGREIYDTFLEAREVFQEVDEALKQNLSRLIFSGDPEELTITSNAQPAIMAVSMAVMRVLEKQGGIDISKFAAYVAGHSLGEYSALAAAQAFKLVDTACLLRIRGKAMLKASEGKKGAMLALLGAEFSKAEELCSSLVVAGILVIANDNGAGQIVLSGEERVIDMAVLKATEFGIKKAIKLNVSSAFHSPLMKGADLVMAKALDEVKIVKPLVPLIQNISADKTSDITAIREGLVEQVCGTVRWRETIQYLASAGIERFIEIGPSQVLTNLTKRIIQGANCTSLERPNDIGSILE